ncbi:MAG: hypothetical protein OXG35_26065 [Acidobacteria bacterium]|nr:hypothetical protein [Acidobacteriota bacterium]
MLSEAGGMALLGVVLGVASAVVLTRRLQAPLFETAPLDPVVFGAVRAPAELDAKRAEGDD